MEYIIDLPKMIASIKNAPTDDRKIDAFIETDGEQYIFDNIFKKLLNEEKIKISDIDFDAFDEEDIVNIIDNKLYDMEKMLVGVEKIAQIFISTPPKPLMARRFF